ncbi:MAG: hypothetical protein AAGC95_18335 [Pseudomonadota bacterium]
MQLFYLCVIILGVFFIGLFSTHLRRAAATAPLLCIAAGWALSAGAGATLSLDFNERHAGALGEAGLAMLLFLNASQIRLGRIGRDHPIALRVSTLALPLQFALGCAAAMVFFPGLAPWTAFLLIAVLLPTDIAPWRRALAHQGAPLSIRKALCADGVLTSAVVLPMVLAFAACASVPADGARPLMGLELTYMGVILGLLLGAFVGASAARVMRLVENKKLKMAVGLIAGGAAYAIAPLAEADGAMAALAAGFAIAEGRGKEGLALRRIRGAFERRLTPLAYVAFGAFLLPRALPNIDMLTAVFALFLVTFLRLVPRYMAVGRGLHGESRFFVAGFGGHGAVAILMLITLANKPVIVDQELVVTAASLAIFLSVILMRLTADPLALRYGKRVNALRARGLCRREFAD